MLIQSLSAQAFVFVPVPAPQILDVRIVDIGGGSVQVQTKVVG